MRQICLNDFGSRQGNISNSAIESMIFLLTVKSHGVETNLPTVKKVGIKQVSSVISEVYGSRLVTSASQAPTFPLQQKLMICTVLLMVRGGRLKEITLGKVRSTTLPDPQTLCVLL